MGINSKDLRKGIKRLGERPGFAPRPMVALETGTPEDVEALVKQAQSSLDEAVRLANASAKKLGIIEASEDERFLAENSRKQAEDLRVAAENMRKAAEIIRIENEQLRQGGETARGNAEQTRNTAEAARVLAEEARAASAAAQAVAEQARVVEENSRKSAEQTRQSNEASRVTAESARASAEEARATAAAATASAEALRVAAENARVAAETLRAAAEAARQSAFETNEAARAAAYTAAEANRDSAYTTAENARDAAFAAKEATRDAANQAALDCAETLDALGQKVVEVAGGEIIPEVTWSNGMLYKSGTATAVSTNANYQKSSVITVKKGDVVTFTGGNDSETVAVFAVCSYDNGTHIGLQLYSSTSQETVTWTAPSNMQIVISTKKNMASGSIVIERQSAIITLRQDTDKLLLLPNMLDVTTGAMVEPFTVNGFLATGDLFTVASSNKSVIFPIAGGKTFDILANGTNCIYAFLKSLPTDFSATFSLSPYYATGTGRNVANNRGQGTTPTDARYIMLSSLVNGADWSARWAKIDGYDYTLPLQKQLSNLQATTDERYAAQNAPKRWFNHADFQINDIFLNGDFVTSTQLSSIVKFVLYNGYNLNGTYLVGLLFRDSSDNTVVDGRVMCSTSSEAEALIAKGFIDLPHIKYTFKISGNSTTYATSISLDSSVFDIGNSPYVKERVDGKKLPREIKLNVSAENGVYINTQGQRIATSQNYNVTKPISLCPNDVLRVYAIVSETSSALSKVEGNIMIPIYTGASTQARAMYEYTSEEYCDVVVCYYGNDAEISIVQYLREIVVAPVKVPNYYVRYDNSKLIYTSSTSYGISKPVRVFKNDRLKLSIQANSGVTGVLSLCDKDGDRIVPIFVADGSSYTSYEYIVKENGYVMVSGDFSTNPAPTLEISRQNIRQNFETLLHNTRQEVEYIRDKHYYSEDVNLAIPENYNSILCYKGDTKSNDRYIVNAVAYPDGTIIACRAGGSVVKIAKDGTETSLLSITGAGDWRGMFIDSNYNVYVSPHASMGGIGALSVNDRGLYRLPYNGSTFTKVLALYDTTSSVTTETQNNDDTVWTMCEDNFGRLYAGIYAHSVRANPSIYRSDDGGETWELVCNFIDAGLVTTTQFGIPMHIHCIIYNQYNEALYCIVGEVETIFKSIDGGETWEDLHILTVDEKGTTLIAVPDGILMGSDGSGRGVLSKIYSDDHTSRTTGIMWHAEFFGMRRSDVTGWIYAFSKIESTIGSSTFFPPIAANTDADALASWMSSATATNRTAWEKYNDWVSQHYTHDAIHPTKAAILVSKDNGESWEVIYAEDTNGGSGMGLGIFCVGYFRNGECLCSMSKEINGTKQFVNPVVVSEGKHKFTADGIDLSGEIFAKTNTSVII